MTELAKLIASGVAAFGDLRRELSEGAQALLAIACLALILALIWVVILASPAVSRVHPALIYVPSAALTTLAILVVGGAILQQMVDNRRTLVQQTVDNRKVLNRIRVQLGSTPRIPRYLIGCHLGRRYVACGVVPTRDASPDAAPLGWAQALISNEHVQHEFLGESAPTEQTLYDEAIRQLLEASSRTRKQDPNANFEMIGVAVPGTVDPVSGVLTRSVSTLPSKSHIAQRLARGMFERASADLTAAFRVRNPQELEARIVLDNDVRCATRALHSRATYEDQNFACLSIGSGVGAGFVLDGNLYYGSNREAGEIGHVELDPQYLGHVQLEPTAIGQTKCSCGEFGRHFETMVNYLGLKRLAAQISGSSKEDPLTSLTEALKKDGVIGNRFREHGLPQALTYSLRRDVLEWSHTQAEIDDHSSTYEDFAQKVVRSYAALVGGGIIGVNVTLDLQRVYLCGTLLERFQGLEPFSEMIDVVLGCDRIHHGVQYAYEQSRALVWRGAALVAIDLAAPSTYRAPLES